MSLGSKSGQPSGVQEDIEFLVDRVADLDATVEELQETIHEKNQRIDELERRVDELDQRTDMLRIVEAADDLDAKQRRIALLQVRNPRDPEFGKLGVGSV